MAYARFDTNKDLELKCEEGPMRKLLMFRLPKNMCNKILHFVVFILMVILVIILLFLAVGVFLHEANIPRSKNFQPLQLITSGPNGSVNPGKTCGGVIDVNTTTKIQLVYIVHPSALSCSWIIQSEAEMVNLKWSNGRTHPIPNDDLLVGEFADNELHNCRTIGQATETIIRTPAIIQIQLPAIFPYLVYSEISLTPINGAGTQKNQLATEKHVTEKPRGFAAVFNDVVLGVLENYNDHHICSDDEGFVDCKSVKAYKFNSTNLSSSCTAVPLLSDPSKQPSTLVMLVPTKAFSNSSNDQLKLEQA